MVRVINVSTGRNSATLDKVPKAVLTGSFDYGAKLSTMVKDVALGLKEAEALGVPMWVHENSRSALAVRRRSGLGRCRTSPRSSACWRSGLVQRCAADERQPLCPYGLG